MTIHHPCQLTFILDVFIMKDYRNPRESSDFDTEEFRRLCFVYTTNIIYLLNQDMIVKQVSPSVKRILGYDPEECIGQSFIELNKCDPVDANRVIMDFQALFLGIEISKCEYTCYTADGKELIFEVNGSPFYKKGTIVGLIITAQDITHQKRYETDLQNILGDLRKSLDITIKTISRTIDCKDPHTAGHQQRVSDLSRSIATLMNYSIDVINGIRMAGIVHDIGKISIPAEILSKPGRLHSAELELIKIHPGIGFDILSTIDFPWPIAAAVLFHHERMDGSGYPYGITGEYILPHAKIIGVADVVVAMASLRPYRASIGIEEALVEIEKNAGILYDSEVVAACLSLFRDNNYMFVS